MVCKKLDLSRLGIPGRARLCHARQPNSRGLTNQLDKTRIRLYQSRRTPSSAMHELGFQVQTGTQLIPILGRTKADAYCTRRFAIGHYKRDGGRNPDASPHGFHVAACDGSDRDIQLACQLPIWWQAIPGTEAAVDDIRHNGLGNREIDGIRTGAHIGCPGCHSDN